MKNKTSHKKVWRRIISISFLIFLILFSIFIVLSNIKFYRVPAANLPCRQCSGEARAISVNGFRLYYRELGVNNQHAPIVIIHGGPGHSSASFKASLDFLADEFHVIYYDQRGSGYSQIKPDAGLYTMDQLVEELEAIRKNVIGTDTITLLAHSAGGALAQRYALAYPEHVDSMILVSSIQINNGIRSPAIWDVFNPVFFTIGAGWPPADPNAADAWFQPLIVASSVPRLFNQGNLSLVENSGYISFATWREISRSIEGQDFKDRLSNLHTKTLIIYGMADSTYTGEATATRLNEILPDSALARFEKSGHWAFLEEPDKFRQVILNFLESGD